MKKYIYKYLLTAIALVTVSFLQVNAKWYTLFAVPETGQNTNYNNAWCWDNAEGTNLAQSKNIGNLHAFYTSTGYTNVIFKTASDWNGTQTDDISNATELGLYECKNENKQAGTYKGTAVIRGNFEGEYKNYSLTRVNNSSVYQTPEITTNYSDGKGANFQFYFTNEINFSAHNKTFTTDGTTYSMDDATQGNLAYVNVTNGSKIRIQVDVTKLDMKLVVTQLVEPIPTSMYIAHSTGNDDEWNSSWPMIGNQSAGTFAYEKKIEAGKEFFFKFLKVSEVTNLWNTSNEVFAPAEQDFVVTAGTEYTGNANNETTKGFCWKIASQSKAGVYTVSAEYVTASQIKFRVSFKEDQVIEPPVREYPTEMTLEGIDHIELAAADCAPSFAAAGFTVTKSAHHETAYPDGKEKVLNVNSNITGVSDIEYHWAKYEADGEHNQSPYHLFESDTYIHEQDPRHNIIYDARNSRGELTYWKNGNKIERSHSIEKSNGTSHDCRNFTDAYYRVYAQSKSTSPVTTKSRFTPRAVVSNATAGDGARVAYSDFMADNTTGIDSVAIDDKVVDGPVRYFNLQGIEVAEPQVGQIYIVRIGNTASKQLYR